MSDKRFGLVVDPNGVAEAVEFPADNKLEWYYEKIDCRCIDVVSLYGLEEVAKEYGLESLLGKFCMIVDDEALLVEEPKLNTIASLLYGVDTHGQPICGKVLIAKNEYTEDGVDSVGMTSGDMALLQVSINSLIERHNEKARGKDGRR